MIISLFIYFGSITLESDNLLSYLRSEMIENESLKVAHLHNILATHSIIHFLIIVACTIGIFAVEMRSKKIIKSYSFLIIISLSSRIVLIILQLVYNQTIYDVYGS